MAVHRDTRVSERVAPEKQQERRDKQLYQDTGRCRRHVSGCTFTNCTKRTWVSSNDKAPANELAFCCERLTNIAASERQRARRFRNHLRSSAATPG
jgi:hypothetical protein